MRKRETNSEEVEFSVLKLIQQCKDGMPSSLKKVLFFVPSKIKAFWLYLSPLGRTLWMIVIIKLIIMFLILKPFFFPNLLNSKFDNPVDKANYVREQLTKDINRNKK